MSGGTVDFQLEVPFRAQLLAQATHELTIGGLQTVTVEFVSPVSLFDSALDFGDQNIEVFITTSDGNPLAAPVSVDVLDLLTGTASTPGDYTFATPQTLNWAIGEADGTIKNAVINVVELAPGGTVNLDLDNASGATEGALNTHEVTISSGGA